MDEAKHMALLYFIDHLMQKGGQRTIHDLSCQFGARGFSEEMRDAVGANQEGLTEFLSQYPSLFTVDGEEVSLLGFGEMDGKKHLAQVPRHGRQRDYEQEAVEFFVAKLHKFGPELQIKSLLGHRSQAAPEVRLISGRHLKDFVDFLASQTEDFIVEGDRVRLKNMPEPSGEQFVDDEGQPLAGAKAKQAVVEYLRGALEEAGEVPIPMDTFYRKYCDRFPHTVRQEVATNPKELLQFLKLNREIFFIRSSKVSLVREKPEDGEDEGETTESEKNGVGSESGHSTGEGGSKSPPRRQATLNGGSSTAALHPLDKDNLHRVEIAKTVEQAKEMVASLRRDMDTAARIKQQNGEKNAILSRKTLSKGWMAVDFKTMPGGKGSSSAAVPLHSSGVGEETLSLIVAATQRRVVVFDLASDEALLRDSGLAELLESPTYLKVIHEARRSAAVLSRRYSTQLRNVFDTQLAHSVIQHDKFGKPLAELSGISFINLQRVYHPQALMLSDSVTPKKLSQGPPNWGQRPLTDEMLLAACEKCHCLASALYPRIEAQLPAERRQLFEERCEEAVANSPLAGGGGSPIKKLAKMVAPAAAVPLLHSQPSLPSPLLATGPLFAGRKGSSGENGVGGGSYHTGPPTQLLYQPPASRRGYAFREARAEKPTPLIPELLNGGGGGAGGGGRGKATSPLMSLPYKHPTQLGQHPAAGVPSTDPQRYHLSNRKGQVMKVAQPAMADAETQTVSTGEITVLHVYYDEDAEGERHRREKKPAIRG